MIPQLFDLLQEELRLLDGAADILVYSYERCKDIGFKGEYGYEDLDRIEALTSRFARLSDILLQKIFRVIDEIDLETSGTMRDRINRAEKKGIIGDADTFIRIRTLRNDIAHEYSPEAIREIHKVVMELTPDLLEGVSRTKVYCHRYL